MPVLASNLLPPAIKHWFTARGWEPHAHQLEMVASAQRGQHNLLIAPTGGGKTLTGFLPSLVELSQHSHKGLHTLYISPIKALSADIQRNLSTPIAEMGLSIRTETRTGDTKASARARQRKNPPQILLTTPESLALLLSYEDSPEIFGSLKHIIIDELHALAPNNRGDLLALGLARLQSLAPGLRRVGLSATVRDPNELLQWLSPRPRQAEIQDVTLVQGHGGAKPDVSIQAPPQGEAMPWAGHMGLYAAPQILAAIAAHRMTIVFVNTRAQVELIFNELWRLNEDALPIAMHHGSLDPQQRQKVEAAMASGQLRAVIATASLDLGIDWGDVDLVIQVGAPKGVSRLVQRIGRANHRLDTPSKAILVPASRFELLECTAAKDGIEAHTLDGDLLRPGGLDVLCQHLIGMSCANGFDADELFAEITSAAPYAHLTPETFDDALAFASHGGYALRVYERFQKIAFDSDTALYGIASPRHAQRYRMNVGTIVEAPMLKVRLGRGKVLGEVEEGFATGLSAGDCFLFTGRLLEFVEIRDMSVITRTAHASRKEPSVPVYGGNRMPLSTHLADRVRAMIQDKEKWRDFPNQVQEWLALQERFSQLPGADKLLIETFPRGEKHYLVAYCFEGRLAHTTLGMLLTRRMERFGFGPLGYVCSDYVFCAWSLKPVTDVDALFDIDMLGDDLEAWMDESFHMKRTFRKCAVISHLIEKNQPGAEKNRRQVTFNNDIIYDVLRRHEPDHILLKATRQEAAAGYTDVSRLADMLERYQGNIEHRKLNRISPMAVPVMLEIGREPVQTALLDELIETSADDLLAEATASATPGTQAGD